MEGRKIGILFIQRQLHKCSNEFIKNEHNSMYLRRVLLHSI